MNKILVLLFFYFLNKDIISYENIESFFTILQYINNISMLIDFNLIILI